MVKNVTVKNNLITRIGEDYLGTAGINAGFVNSTTIDHNDISDTPWAGISLGWGWQSAANAEGNNSVSYNRIGNVMNRLCDSAGIYHLSNDPNTVINGNYVHDAIRVPSACGNAVHGVYLDEGSDNMTLSNNVLSRTDGFINQNRNGSNVTLTNNTTSGDSVIKASGLESAYQGLATKLNLAYNKSASSSSVYDSGTPAANAVDNNNSTGWSPTGSDSSAWWQVDLGQAYQLGQFSLTTRQNLDQSETRGNFEIRASNDPSFGSYTVLGRQEGHPAARRDAHEQRRRPPAVPLRAGRQDRRRVLLHHGLQCAAGWRGTGGRDRYTDRQPVDVLHDQERQQQSDDGRLRMVHRRRRQRRPVAEHRWRQPAVDHRSGHRAALQDREQEQRQGPRDELLQPLEGDRGAAVDLRRWQQPAVVLRADQWRVPHPQLREQAGPGGQQRIDGERSRHRSVDAPEPVQPGLDDPVTG